MPADQGRRERARLLLLSKYSDGWSIDADSLKTYWDEPLGEPAAATVRRFISDGLLAPAELPRVCDVKYKVTDLKDLLRERKLPVSGKKEQLIERLFASDAAGMEALLKGLNVYVCTSKGAAIVRQHEAEEAERVARVESQVMQKMRDGDLRGAIVIFHQHKRPPIFPNPIGIESSLEEDLAMAQEVLEARPKILKDMAEEEWRVAQIAATMAALSGARSGRAWLPADFKGVSNLDPETAVRMIVFAGKSRKDIAQFRELGCTNVRITDCGEASCAACRKLPRVYKIENAPELPFEHCTSPMGCRCMLLPEFD